MKNILLAFFCLFYSLSFSQNRTLSGTEAAKAVTGADRIVINGKRNTTSFIHLQNYTVPASENFSWLKSALALKQDEDFKLRKVEDDYVGFTHYRYDQTFKNVPVQYGVYYVHTQGGRIISANGEWYRG